MIKIWGYRRLKLLQEIAEKSKSREQLAREYGVKPSAITHYAVRFAAEIEQITIEQENALAGLWIVDKVNRLAEYEAQVERFRDSDDARLVTRVQTALRSVAEELGQLPARLQVQHELGHGGQPVPALLERLDQAAQANKAIEASLGINTQVVNSEPAPEPVLITEMAQEESGQYGEVDSSEASRVTEE